jgi:hypothetical protein
VIAVMNVLIHNVFLLLSAIYKYLVIKIFSQVAS